MNYHIHNSLDSASSPASNAGFFAQEPILGACSNPDRSRRIGSPLGIPLSRLAKGAALLGCALACVQEASAQFGYLATGTVSNFSVTATSGLTTGSISITGPSIGFYSSLNITGRGAGNALAVNFPSFAYVDLVGFTISDTVANSSGGGSGSFTMNFTASVLFYDFATFAYTSPDWTTSWNVTGLGSISNGQSFSPGFYTFNFVTTHVLPSTSVIGAATFFAVPEASPSGLPLWTGGLLLVAGTARRRRSRARSRALDQTAV